jgi:hypothetical protein
VLLTRIGGRELLPDTFYRIGDQIAQKYVDTQRGEIKYRILQQLEGRRRRDGTCAQYYNFKDVHDRQYQCSVDIAHADLPPVEDPNDNVVE